MFKRIQFTPDLMPTDITGTDIIEEDPVSGHRTWTFVQGPIFANVLLADEINRTPPKTQSALLEAMQERACTVRGNNYQLPAPFFVLATQNPIELEGTYPLPEAQLDRFLFNILLDYLTAEQEMQVIDLTTTTHVAQADPITNAEEILDFQQLVRMTPIARNGREVCDRTGARDAREDPGAPEVVKKYVNYGGSVRAAQFLVLAAKARALMKGRVSRQLRRCPRALYPDSAAPYSVEFPCGIGPADAGRHFDAGAGVEAGAEGVDGAQTASHNSCCSDFSIPRYSLPSRRSIWSRRRWWMASLRACTARRNSVSARSSPNIEQYVQGDDLRHIDWNVFARTERFYLKRFKGETNMQLLILLDASASMTYGSGKHQQAGLRALRGGFAGLSFSQQRDATGLIVFDQECRITSRLRPGKGS